MRKSGFPGHNLSTRKVVLDASPRSNNATGTHVNPVGNNGLTGNSYMMFQACPRTDGTL